MKSEQQRQQASIAQKVFSKEFEELIAHELRTPLSSIMGFAEMMADDPALSVERCREFAKIIMREGKRLSQIVDLVLLHSASKQTADKKPAQYEYSGK
ncbi:MAG: hypothetical protein L0Y80_12285 [Ignavibacteriae bacterium]|nr:hypothetical protein [Ignavibacteriota bacterium]